MKSKKKLVGDFGEKIAKDYLIRNQYNIIDKNIKIHYKEIDIIASKNNFIVFFEVKTSTISKYVSPEDNFSLKKQNNFKKVVLNYLLKNNLDFNLIRFDLIAINIDRGKNLVRIKHYKDLF